MSLSDAVGHPCEIKAKKEQMKSHVYISTTVVQHLSTYSSSKVQGDTTFGLLLMKFLQCSVNICFVDTVLGMTPPGLILHRAVFERRFYSLLQCHRV